MANELDYTRRQLPVAYTEGPVGEAVVLLDALQGRWRFADMSNLLVEPLDVLLEALEVVAFLIVQSNGVAAGLFKLSSGTQLKMNNLRIRYGEPHIVRYGFEVHLALLQDFRSFNVVVLPRVVGRTNAPWREPPRVERAVGRSA